MAAKYEEDPKPRRPAVFGESERVVLAAQSGRAVAIARIVCTDGSWIEAHEVP